MTARPEGFEMVVGLEVHVQLATTTKIFCNCPTDFGAPPNASTCPVCLGMPGALPVLNAHAVELAVRAAVALGCEVQGESVFARKHYFYPDLPKGYQISQFDRPLALQGMLEVEVGGSRRPIRIARLHMEEDAGKSVHDRFPGATAVDLNRAGVPLVEIVTEPDFRTTGEVAAYLRELKQIMEYTEVSDVSMERGSLRVDANISARRRGDDRLGTKTEVKNLNSFSGVVRALEIEFARQCASLEAGRAIAQETMLFDAHADTVRPARGKEGSHDYRYFPDPDLPVLVLPRATIDTARATLPELPATRRARYHRDYKGLAASEIDLLTSDRELARYFEAVVVGGSDAKAAANWLLGDIAALLKRDGTSIAHFSVLPQELAALIALVRDEAVSGTAAKQILARVVETGRTPGDIARDEHLLKVSDTPSLDAWIDRVLADHPDEAGRYLAGERRLQGVLVGHVMRASGGSADPKRVNQLLAERSARSGATEAE